MAVDNVLSGFVNTVELDKISLPKQILRRDLGALDDLRNSIGSCGLLQPIVIRPVEDGFEIVAGNRRFEACRQLGWQRIPSHIMTLNDREAFEVALVENIQRKTLNPFEEAQAFKMYVKDFGWGGVTDLARRIGKSSQYVSQRLQLLRLPPDILRKLDEGVISPSLLREIIGLDEDIQRTIVELAVSKKLSSRRVSRISKRFKSLDPVIEPFPNLHSAVSEDDQRLRLMDRLFRRCIDALRISLLEFDEVINSVNDEWIVRDLLMAQRRIIHSQIDVLIRSRKRFRNIPNEVFTPL